MVNQLRTGDPAPDFEAMAVGAEYGSGTKIKLSDFRGERLVLYFYPKDDTPGCTKQACGIRDAWSEITTSNATIFGVSVDDPASHSKFIEKYHLPFALLSDSQHHMVKAYGVWVEKSMYGKKYMGTERTTFVIGRDGRIDQILRKVAPSEHVKLLIPALI
jgi:peroxiredoxin Q/BCP